MEILIDSPHLMKGPHVQLSDDLREQLQDLAMKATENFCYSCYKVVTQDHCPKCGTDDFMRYLDGVGVEYRASAH
jgi:hypothetical protein